MCVDKIVDSGYFQEEELTWGKNAKVILVLALYNL